MASWPPGQLWPAPQQSRMGQSVAEQPLGPPTPPHTPPLPPTHTERYKGPGLARLIILANTDTGGNISAVFTYLWCCHVEKGTAQRGAGGGSCGRWGQVSAPPQLPERTAMLEPGGNSLCLKVGTSSKKTFASTFLLSLLPRAFLQALVLTLPGWYNYPLFRDKETEAHDHSAGL